MQDVNGCVGNAEEYQIAAVDFAANAAVFAAGQERMGFWLVFKFLTGFEKFIHK